MQQGPAPRDGGTGPRCSCGLDVDRLHGCGQLRIRHRGRVCTGRRGTRQCRGDPLGRVRM